MSREQVISLALDAGFDPYIITQASHKSIENLRRLIELAAAAEREECAKVCEVVAFYDQMGPRDCADMIRARSA